MVWINGVERQFVHVDDRGLQFGDGCFTTATVHDSRVVLLALHLQRLQQDCQRLQIASVDWCLLQQEIQQRAANATNAVMKVIVTRGQAGGGYSCNNSASPNYIIMLRQPPSHYQAIWSRGARLITCPLQLAANPLLAGVKHLNRLEQVLIRRHIDACGADEAIVLDYNNHLVECCAANLFWRCSGIVYTPSLQQAGVNGVMRRYLIQQLCELGYKCRETTAPLSALIAADEIFICNALMPILPVYQIDQHIYPCRQLAERLHTHYRTQALT